MQAIVVHEGGGPDVLKIEEVPDPTATDGQVLVRVEAAAVNHFDITQRMAPEMAGATPPSRPGWTRREPVSTPARESSSPARRAPMPS
jgi:NADPH2:quinone reductase